MAQTIAELAGFVSYAVHQAIDAFFIHCMPEEIRGDPQQRPHDQRGIEFVEQCLGIVEAAAVAVEAGFAQEPEGNSGLAGAGRPDEQDIVGTTYEVEAGKGVDRALGDGAGAASFPRR